jgi:DNA-binding protein WhiA
VFGGGRYDGLLTRLGAHDSVLAWEERRMRREVRATANRLANFDDANLRRSARAAVAAGARVERALEIARSHNPDKECKVTFPLDPEAFFIEEPVAGVDETAA